MSFLSNGMFGLGGMDGFSPPVPNQLAGMYDKKAMKKAQIKSLLTNAGLAMLSQGPSQMPINLMSSIGQGLQKGVQAADQTGQDYRDTAYQTFKINQDQEALARQKEQQDYERQRQGINDQYAAQNQAHQQQTWAQEEDQRKQREAYAATLPPNERAMFLAFPQIYMQQANGPERFMGTPLPMQNPDGTFGYVIPSNRGNVKSLSVPGGGAFLSPEGKAFQKSKGAAEGEMTGKQNMAAPQDVQAGMNALKQIEAVRNSPNKAWGTGGSSVFNAIPGTPGRDFQNQVEGLKSGAFLSAIQQMRGLGSLSDAEGKAATAAINRMDTSTSEEAFNAALNDYEMIVRQGLAKAQARLNGGSIDPTRGGPIPQPNNSGTMSDEQLLQMYGG